MKRKAILLNLLGLACCLTPPALVTFQYFPLWRDTVGLGATVGGGAAVLIVIVFIVLAKYVNVKVKLPSPIFLAWGLFFFFELMKKVSVGLSAISFWLAVGCSAGAVLFLWARRYEK